ncbi:MAG: hypothetical protein M3179_06960, partial [Actinomycetota bacterium]|nr:hypothetical protein [Actinomycetota bacterium]
MRKIGLLASAVGVVMVIGAASAWACTNLASLNPSQTSGNPGTQITLTGTAYATKGGSDVAIRWNSTTAPPLTTVKADPAGTIRAEVTIPADAKPGNHILIATQDYTDSSGVTTAAYGTPARATFTVGGAAPAPAPPAAATASAAASSDGTPAGLVALTVLLGIGGLVLFAGGLAVFARQTRRRPVPSPV